MSAPKSFDLEDARRLAAQHSKYEEDPHTLARDLSDRMEAACDEIKRLRTALKGKTSPVVQEPPVDPRDEAVSEKKHELFSVKEQEDLVASALPYPDLYLERLRWAATVAANYTEIERLRAVIASVLAGPHYTPAGKK